MTRKDVKPEEHHLYYRRYIDKLSINSGLIECFTVGLEEVVQFFQAIPEKRLLHSYEQGKWTIKEVLQHLIDSERSFMHRCFRMARRDITSLAGFNQEIYIPTSRENKKSINQLLVEYSTNRENSISLLKSLSRDDLKFIGHANGGPMSARAAAFVVPGHDIWHMEIIKERYL